MRRLYKSQVALGDLPKAFETLQKLKAIDSNHNTEAEE